MNISIIKPDIKHTEGITEVCSTGWKQTVEGTLSEEYQKKNVDFWYNHDRVYNDIMIFALGCILMLLLMIIRKLPG